MMSQQVLNWHFNKKATEKDENYKEAKWTLNQTLWKGQTLTTEDEKPILRC